MTTSTDFDLIIVGAGMVGASLAASLRDQQLNILLVDKCLPKSQFKTEPHLRVSSINLGAIRWLKQQAIWPNLDPARLQPYTRLSAYEQNNCCIDFNASEVNEKQLGVFVENEHLQQAALQQASCQTVTGQINHITPNDSGVEIALDNGDTYRCKLLVGADGGHSYVAKQLKFAEKSWQYRQSCFSVIVEMQQRNEAAFQQTWQLFRPQGPIAFLPLFANYASLIVYDDPAKVQTYQGWNASQVENLLQTLFADRLPQFKVISYAGFKLARRTIQQPYQHNTLLIGDAAHNIHPLAGQGVNLGLRDVAALSHLIKDKLAKQQAWHTLDAFQPYLKERKLDVEATSGAMDITYKLFSNDIPLVKSLRKLALNSLNSVVPLKQTALKFALGLNSPYV
ncbi:hypothetical protein C2869_18590 [Saccharobesus litoralis]|uniref:FAD-binding domain-containing protein n=1 Tax=Saccharobesus litoralis TaxID=2172099 RepID=A0A2S0VVQ0_9ALTE|nr:FAD-dependent monooxygenase [Saccharobesus litoralis]AWB68297.1 hypothetical protein C2869_18590 [Saccharobesus litoralis]